VHCTFNVRCTSFYYLVHCTFNVRCTFHIS